MIVSHRSDDMASLPDFFIAGAARSGTTSMWRYLQQHPDIFMPEGFYNKEPSYYCHNRKGFGVADRDAYLRLFANSEGKQRIGEASGAYLTSPESPALIRREIPRAHFLIMLRNPADRAFSLYKWMRQYGFEKIPSFEGALAAEEERSDSKDFKRNNGQYYFNFLYFRSGIYHDQLKRFFDNFGRDRVHVILFEDFAKRTLQTVQETYRFLGVDSGFAPEIAIHNASVPKFGECSVELRRSLLERYMDSIEELARLLGRDLASIWK